MVPIKSLLPLNVARLVTVLRVKDRRDSAIEARGKNGRKKSDVID